MLRWSIRTHVLYAAESVRSSGIQARCSIRLRYDLARLPRRLPARTVDAFTMLCKTLPPWIIQLNASLSCTTYINAMTLLHRRMLLPTSAGSSPASEDGLLPESVSHMSEFVLHEPDTVVPPVEPRNAAIRPCFHTRGHCTAVLLQFASTSRRRGGGGLEVKVQGRSQSDCKHPLNALLYGHVQ